MHPHLKAYESRQADAHAAFAVYAQMCGDQAPPRVPGMDTVIRLAVRLDNGRTIEEAAAREYLYRWRLAIKDADQTDIGSNSSRNPCVSIFGAPHLIGM